MRLQKNSSKGSCWLSCLLQEAHSSSRLKMSSTAYKADSQMAKSKVESRNRTAYFEHLVRVMFSEVQRIASVGEGSHKRLLSAMYVLDDTIARTLNFTQSRRRRVGAGFHDDLKARLAALRGEAMMIQKKSFQAYEAKLAEAAGCVLEDTSDSSIEALQLMPTAMSLPSSSARRKGKHPLGKRLVAKSSKKPRIKLAEETPSRKSFPPSSTSTPGRDILEPVPSTSCLGGPLLSTALPPDSS